MDVLGVDREKTFHSRVDGLTASVLEDHGHGCTLIQNTELALGALGVGGVGEDTAVEEGSVGVCNHGTDVTGTVRLLALAGVLQRVEVSVAPLVPVHAVTLVDGVDGARGRQLHVGMGEDELAEGVLEGETVDTAVLHGDDQLGGGTVHGEAGGNHLSSGTEDILGCDLLSGTEDVVGKLEDTENSTN